MKCGILKYTQTSAKTRTQKSNKKIENSVKIERRRNVLRRWGLNEIGTNLNQLIFWTNFLIFC